MKTVAYNSFLLGLPTLEINFMINYLKISSGYLFGLTAKVSLISCTLLSDDELLSNNELLSDDEL